MPDYTRFKEEVKDIEGDVLRLDSITDAVFFETITDEEPEITPNGKWSLILVFDDNMVRKIRDLCDQHLKAREREGSNADRAEEAPGVEGVPEADPGE